MFVGNLNYDTTQADLQGLFSQVGEVVEVFIPTDRATGRPRGFAFVEFRDSETVERAVDKFNGYELLGRSLRVNAAEDRPPRRPSSGPPPPSLPPEPPPFDGDRPPWGKTKGSRRRIRSRKRGF